MSRRQITEMNESSDQHVQASGLKYTRKRERNAFPFTVVLSVHSPVLAEGGVAQRAKRDPSHPYVPLECSMGSSKRRNIDSNGSSGIYYEQEQLRTGEAKLRPSCCVHTSKMVGEDFESHRLPRADHPPYSPELTASPHLIAIQMKITILFDDMSFLLLFAIQSFIDALSSAEKQILRTASNTSMRKVHRHCQGKPHRREDQDESCALVPHLLDQLL